MKIHSIIFGLAITTASVYADDSTLDAAIGGGIGGAAGAALGNEIGGRDGAIIGGALGGAVGAAVNTEENNYHGDSSKKASYRSERQYMRPASRFCPPGQAKKGRC
jgi:phage tail tape-measure protein